MTTTTHEPTLLPVPAALLARWSHIPVPVAVDLVPSHQISPAIRSLRPAGQQSHLCARAVTARCAAPDFGAVLKSLERVGPGEVLVIDAGGHAANAMIGDVLGGFLHGRGAAGVICDGAIRDTGTLAKLEGFPVYARHITPRGPVGADQGEVNLTVTIGGCTVSPGDLILGDDDGLAAIPAAQLAGLIDAAEARLRLEADWTRRLAAGDPVSSIFGLD